MNWTRVFPTIALTVVLLGATPVSQPAYLAPDQFDFKSLLVEPPADGSPAQKQEMEQLLEMQADRTPAEIKRCEAEVKSDAFIFADVLGPDFNAKDLPIAASLLHDATKRTAVVVSAAKANFNRKRPYLVDPRLHPCVQLEKSTSFPSGHATRGMLWGLILAELYPNDRDLLVGRGMQYGVDRNIGGVHYPGDVRAGQKLAAEIVKRMLADPEFQAELRKAKEECHAEAAAGK